VKNKSKGVAYFLWLFLGLLGFHKFYLEKHLMGIIYFFTAGLLGVGWFIDLFTLGNQVDAYNALHQDSKQQQSQQQSQNIVVNVGTDSVLPKTSAEKQIRQLTEENPQLSLRDIVAKTSLESEEAEKALERMAAKGMIREIVDPSGKKLYDAS